MNIYCLDNEVWFSGLLLLHDTLDWNLIGVSVAIVISYFESPENILTNLMQAT